MRFARPLRRLLPPLALATALAAATAQAQTSPAPTDTPSPPATAAPAWSPAQWRALWDAAQHTAGTTAYEYKWAFYTDIGRARVARVSGLRNVAVRTAPNLLSVHPAIRLTLQNLYTPGEKSQPLAFNNRGTPGYVVVELVRTSRAVPLQPGPEFEKAAALWVANGLLPAPDALLADASERARAAYWQALTPQAVQAVPAELSPNVEYGNHLTPLTRAMLARRWELVQALLDHGADPLQCGVLGCVPHLVVAMPDPAQAAQWLALLLARGARPDTVDPRNLASADTALANAIAQDRMALAEALVQAGASPDGVPGVLHTPLLQAALSHRKDSVQWLIAHGASVLPWKDRALLPFVGASNLATAAQSTGDADFTAWAEKTMLDAANASAAYRFEAFVEQDGKRYPLLDGATPKIKAAPFRLVLVLPPGASDSVTLGASFQKSWADEVRNADRRNPMFRPFSSAALAEPSSEDSYDLLVGQPCPADAKPDDTCPGAQFVLQTDATARKDFHSIRPAAHEYVREVRRIFDVSTMQVPAVPLDQFRGKTLQLVLSTAINVGGMDGLRLIHPRFVALSLQ